jgi:hypothetical protein
MEGISRPAFRIARELANNSRSGLTTRFLAKKLDLPLEEVEYLVDLYPRLFFTDLTKIKISPEGTSAVRRILDGLENYGDVPSVFRLMKSLEPPEFRRIEDLLDVDRPLSKKAIVEQFLDSCYQHPDSIVSFVAKSGFSSAAREVFDIIWQSRDGLMPVGKLRALHGGSEYEVEQSLWEMFRSFTLFEMFRFDAEDRLVRVAGLLAELRQHREARRKALDAKSRLKPSRSSPDFPECRDLDLSDKICRLVAALAARPARTRGDSELFREDLRRLNEIVPEDATPSLAVCLWIAEGIGWLARVDNELRAGKLDALLKLDRVARHRVLAEWLLSPANEKASRDILARMLEDLRTGAWHSTIEFVRHIARQESAQEQTILRAAGGHWHYVSPVLEAGAEKGLVRSLEETLFWLGIVDRGEDSEGNSLFRVTCLGEALLTGGEAAEVENRYPAGEATFLVQPNFDIVAPAHEIDPLLTVPLDQFCERGSTGGAAVYHLTKESFTRALQEGHDGDAFIAFLLTHNRGRGRNDDGDVRSLPSNVMTTLEDWRGGVKRVRLRTIQVLETDDPLVMADIMHRRRLRKYFKPVDTQKTVGYGGISRSELAAELEKDGFIIE